MSSTPTRTSGSASSAVDTSSGERATSTDAAIAVARSNQCQPTRNTAPASSATRTCWSCTTSASRPPGSAWTTQTNSGYPGSRGEVDGNNEPGTPSAWRKYPWVSGARNGLWRSVRKARCARSARAVTRTAPGQGECSGTRGRRALPTRAFGGASFIGGGFGRRRRGSARPGPPQHKRRRHGERHRAADHRDEDPGPDGPPALGALALAGRDRAGDGVDPRRPRGDDRRVDRRPADGEGQRPLHHGEPDRLGGGDLRRRRVPRARCSSATSPTASGARSSSC